MMKYAKAIVAAVGSLVTWAQINVQITDESIIIPLTPEAAGWAGLAAAIVFGVYRVPNKG